WPAWLAADRFVVGNGRRGVLGGMALAMERPADILEASTHRPTVRRRVGPVVTSHLPAPDNLSGLQSRSPRHPRLVPWTGLSRLRVAAALSVGPVWGERAGGAAPDGAGGCMAAVAPGLVRWARLSVGIGRIVPTCGV